MQKDNMEDDEVVVSATEIIKGRLYFATLRAGYKPKSTRNSRYFSIEGSIVYENFYLDFGPYHICHLYQFCKRLQSELSRAAPRKLVFTTSDDEALRLNAACLIGCYQIIYLNRTPETVHAALTDGSPWSLLTFRDASGGPALFHITLLDVFRGLHKALQHRFFDFDDFNEEEYLFYETVENGDLNWIIPGKMLAFSGPHARSLLERGYPLHAPEHYHQYFKRHNVSTVVRLNKKSYEAAQFTRAGFQHKELFFVDGGVPSDGIVDRFLRAAEAAPGGLAVHCKAGLGRTGTLIACYLMKHYDFTAREAIAWLRLCRPGSVIGHQQWFLENVEARMHLEGATVRKRRGGVPSHEYGIYSIRQHQKQRTLHHSPSRPVSLATILNNNTSPATNSEPSKRLAAKMTLDNANAINGNADAVQAAPGATNASTAPTRHYMLPTSSAAARARLYGKTGTFPPLRHDQRLRRKPAPRTNSMTRKKPAAEGATAGALAARRKRDKSAGAECGTDATDGSNPQGDRLYKIKALRTKCVPAPAPARTVPAAPARTRAATKK